MVFAHWGVIGHGVGDATQAAWVPLRHIVKEVAGSFGGTGLEDFLLLAYGEPLGAPVCAILEQVRPSVGLFVLVGVDEMGS